MGTNEAASATNLCATSPDAEPPRPGIRPITTSQWGAILAAARHRRAPHFWPSPRTARAESPGAALVRAYVLPEHERARALAAQRRTP